MAAMLQPAEAAAARARNGALAWAAAIALLLLVPLPAVAEPPAAWRALPFDKLVHVLLFLGLGVAWQRWWRAASRGRSGAWTGRAAVAAAATAWGGLLELAQGALGLGRVAEWGDLAADAAGALAAACLAGLL
jgi:VanZ family protein